MCSLKNRCLVDWSNIQAEFHSVFTYWMSIFKSADVKTILMYYFLDHASDNPSPLFKNLLVP